MLGGNLGGFAKAAGVCSQPRGQVPFPTRAGRCPGQVQHTGSLFGIHHKHNVSFLKPHRSATFPPTSSPSPAPPTLTLGRNTNRAGGRHMKCSHVRCRSQKPTLPATVVCTAHPRRSPELPHYHSSGSRLKPRALGMILLLCNPSSSRGRRPLPDVWVFADQSRDFQVEQGRICQLNHFCNSDDSVTVPIHFFTKSLGVSVEIMSSMQHHHALSPTQAGVSQTLSLAEDAWLASPFPPLM